MKSGIRNALSTSGSVKVGFFLLICLTTASLAFSIFPADEIETFSKYFLALSTVNGTPPEASLSFQPRFESPLLLLLVAVLSLSLATSVFLRMKAEFSRRNHQRRASASSATDWATSGNSQDLLTRVLHVLRLYRYHPRVNHSGESATIMGEKGSNGILGSVLFHSSILVILLGVAASTIGSFRGSVPLTEGQTFDSDRNAYAYKDQGRLYDDPNEGLMFRLDKVEPDHGVNGASTVASILSTRNQELLVFINHKGVIGGREIHQGFNTGFSPGLFITQKERVIFEGFLRLAALHRGERIDHRDILQLSGAERRIEFEFLPDAVLRNGEFSSRSQNLNNPLLGISIVDGTVRTPVQWIPIGAEAQLGEITVTFGEIRRWTQLDVVDDSGKNIMLVGAILGSLGLGIRLLSVRRRVTVTLSTLNGKAAVEIHGTTEKFPAEFRYELASLRIKLQLLLLEVEGGAESMNKSGFDEDERISEKALEEVS